MHTIRIGSETRSLADATESWINEQINWRRHDGQNACVEVAIDTGGLKLDWPHQGVAGAGEAAALRTRINEVFDLWPKQGLNSVDFTAGTSWLF